MAKQETVRDALEKMNAENVRLGTVLYSRRPIPCDLDQIVRILVKLFMEADSSEKREIISMIPADDGAFLITFAGRMATLGVREHSREQLLEGLIALIMENYKVDWRDTVMRFAPIYDATLRIGSDPEGLFSEAAAFFKSETSTDVANFPARPPELRTLEAMGYKEGSDADGFRYERSF